MTGEDGGMVPDLRGLAAWLSVHCREGRPILIQRDPLGVVLYGDVRNYPVADKQLVLTALKNAAQHYPWFRFDDWSSSPFGALGTTDMESAFTEILSSPSRTESDQALLDCVLDAIRYGGPMSKLTGALETIARDASYLTAIRKNAVRAIMHVALDHRSILLKLAQDIRAGTIEDRDDEMLGVLLSNLYPLHIPHEQILDYLHPPKDHNLTGNYYVFWIRELPKQTADDDLPLLLDLLVHKNIALRRILRGHQLNKMAGELLVRGLEAHGDTITDERLYDWLGVGADEYGHTRLEGEHRAFVAQWFADRPSRYKAVIEHGAFLCVSQENTFYCMSRCAMRLHGSPAPADIGIWYLEKATTEQQNGLAEYYFHRVIHELIRQGGQQDLTLPALEFLESVTSAHPVFQPWLEQFISCPIGNWQQ